MLGHMEEKIVETKLRDFQDGNIKFHIRLFKLTEGMALK